MDNYSQQLHIVLFPYMVHGHLIPTLDIARLFAARNVKATIITIPVCADNFTRAIDRATCPIIDIEVFRFPAKETELPEGCGSMDQLSSKDGTWPFPRAAEMLQEQLEQYLAKTRPSCLVVANFYPWAAESAAKFNIPTLIFHGTSYFSLSVTEIVESYEPHKTVSTDDEPFAIPLIPHEVTMVRSQIWQGVRRNEESKRVGFIREIKQKSLGVLVNSFYELEPEYAEFYTKELGRRSWHIGPVSLCNRTVEDKAGRGNQASIDQHKCIEWLNSKQLSSVIYICFGSISPCTDPQLHEIAKGLEGSGQNFIWVVKKDENDRNEDWLPQGFEERMEGKCLIIRGWAPQVLILEHEAIGAFVTHCGWNSTLEGISAGVPMVTWPIFAEQFFNEKLVTQILKIGVPVGAKKWAKKPSVEDVINQDAIEKALREVMEGEEAEEMRNIAKRLKQMAWKAVQEGGSSYSDLTALIDELRGSS